MTPATPEIEILNRGWDAIERDDRGEFRAIARASFHPQCEWTPLLSGVDGRYEDRQFEELGSGVILASCRVHLEGRESGASMDREMALLTEWQDGLFRRGRAFDNRAAALEAAEELRAA